MSEERERLAQRLSEAGIETDARFIDVVDGEKKSIGNHDDESNRHPADGVTGNYGVYAAPADELCILDVDDYGDVEDESGLEALRRHLPETLEENTPHGGTHRFYRVQPSEEGRLVSAALEEEFGVQNPKPTWGEVRAGNQYVVGAGSQLDGCTKKWCSDCEESDGGHYELGANREVATISAERLIGVLREDPVLEEDDEEDRDEARRCEQPTGSTSTDFDLEERLELAREQDDKLARLMSGDYSDFRDSSSDGGVDRSAAESSLAAKLGWWLENDTRLVERAMDRYARTQKWDERDDDSYRESILSAVDINTDCYDPEQSSARQDPPSELDWSEVERADAIRRSQTTHTRPVGELECEHGGYGVHWEKRDSDGDLKEEGVDRVTNFTLETLAFLDTEEGTEFVLRVNPNHPTEDSYDVRVQPEVFNSPDTFRSEVVTGRTTWFDANNRRGVPQTTILANLRETVGSQKAPHREGTPHIGLSEDGEEFVTPLGSLTAAGWCEDPDFRFYVKAGDGDETGALAQKWQLDPEEETDVDESDVARICELLPRIRQSERGLPMLGWFYAAPLKPYIHAWEDEFPLLSPHGDTGSGKTSAIRTFMKAFGGDGEPFSAADTSFTIEKHVSESRGFPVWFDEYKPTEMDDRRLKRLHRVLKKVTKEATLPKGTPDLGEVTLHLRAPVVVSGEQKIEDPAVQRRAIITNLSQAAARDGTSTKEAFGELTGTAYEDGDGKQHYPDGYDLGQHARAYYEWILDFDADTLQTWWYDAREAVKEILGRFGVTVEESEQRGLQTVLFGIDVYRRFAEAHGADAADLVSDREVRDACSHVIENIGKDGQRREHADEFLEVLTLAATEGYLQPGEHHRVLDSTAHECEVLAVHMPSAFSAAKRYVRDSNLEDDYSILSKTDYLHSFGNKVEDPESYVLETNKKTRGIDNGSKAVHFDHAAISEKLGSSFNADAFRPDEQRSGGGEATPLAEVSPEGNPYTSVTVEVEDWDDGPPDSGIAHLGTVSDATAVLDVVDYLGDAAIEAGECYRLEQVRVDTYEGAHQLEIASVTEVHPIQAGAGHTEPEDPDDGDAASQTGLHSHDAAQGDEAAADGGQAQPADEEIESAKGRLREALRRFDSGETVSLGVLAGKADITDRDRLESAVAALCEDGTLIDRGDGDYEVNL